MNIEIPFEKIKILPPLVEDFIYQRESAQFLNIPPPSLGAILNQISNKRDFSTENREILVKELENQYDFMSPIEKENSLVWKNIQSLNNPNSFTITTGQQIHIFLGPLFVLHKIQSVVSICKELKVLSSEDSFVPIFWMASEDHDFEEINHINLWGKTFTWNCEQVGAVGEMKCDTLIELIKEIKVNLHFNSEQLEVIEVFEKYYSNSKTLAEATRKLIHHFWGHSGIVVLDANKACFKELFKDILRKELNEGITYKEVSKQSAEIKSKGFLTQIGIKDTNLFYFNDSGDRERIDRTHEGNYILKPSEQQFSKTELLEIAEKNPSRFSPNVALRPVYQETILPNICYIGGAAELNYWFQLKSVFETLKTNFPILILRKHNVKISKKDLEKWKALGFEDFELLLNVEEFDNVIKYKFKGETEKQYFLNKLETFTQEFSDYLFSLSPKEVKGFKKEFKQSKKILETYFELLTEKISKQEIEKIAKTEKIRDIIYPNYKLQERVKTIFEALLTNKAEGYQDFVNKYSKVSLQIERI